MKKFTKIIINQINWPTKEHAIRKNDSKIKMVRLIERSQPKKSFQTLCETLYENIFPHYCPCEFKVQITTIKIEYNFQE